MIVAAALETIMTQYHRMMIVSTMPAPCWHTAHTTTSSLPLYRSTSFPQNHCGTTQDSRFLIFLLLISNKFSNLILICCSYLPHTSWKLFMCNISHNMEDYWIHSVGGWLAAKGLWQQPTFIFTNKHSYSTILKVTEAVDAQWWNGFIKMKFLCPECPSNIASFLFSLLSSLPYIGTRQECCSPLYLLKAQLMIDS